MEAGTLECYFRNLMGLLLASRLVHIDFAPEPRNTKSADFPYLHILISSFYRQNLIILLIKCLNSSS